jgi:non-heme chloroperoxidase
MSKIVTKHDVEIFYKDWGKGQPIVFSHGWPLSADDWDAQMLFFPSKGYRVSPMTGAAMAARRRLVTAMTWTIMPTTSRRFDHLDLKDAIHVGHSTGGGEVVHLARHGEGRVAKAALISAVPPLMLKTASKGATQANRSNSPPPQRNAICELKPTLYAFGANVSFDITLWFSV